MKTALVELNIPSGGDATAAYVALSRVRSREDLYILRAFDVSKLRRSGSKAGVDILLQRLRGELGDDEEGSKRCMRCQGLVFFGNPEELSPKPVQMVSESIRINRRWGTRGGFDRLIRAPIDIWGAPRYELIF